MLSTAQTETTSGVNPVGQMAGHGISAGGTEMFSYNAKEHGYIIVMTSVYPDSLYQQGVERMWRREDNLDYAHPIFANLGEQAIKNSEIYLADTIDPNGDFGYLPRYSEYRYGVSHVTGQMRDDLEYYHLGRRFDEQPLLNESFLNCEPSKRIFAVTDEEEHPIYAHIIVDHKVQRKLPKYGTPQL